MTVLDVAARRRLARALQVVDSVEADVTDSFVADFEAAPSLVFYGDLFAAPVGSGDSVLWDLEVTAEGRLRASFPHLRELPQEGEVEVGALWDAEPALQAVVSRDEFLSEWEGLYEDEASRWLEEGEGVFDDRMMRVSVFCAVAGSPVPQRLRDAFRYSDAVLKRSVSVDGVDYDVLVDLSSD